MIKLDEATSYEIHPEQKQVLVDFCDDLMLVPFEVFDKIVNCEATFYQHLGIDIEKRTEFVFLSACDEFGVCVLSYSEVGIIYEQIRQNHIDTGATH